MLTLLTNVPLDTLVSPEDLVTNLVGAERHEIGHLLCWRRPQGHWAVLKLSDYGGFRVTGPLRQDRQ